MKPSQTLYRQSFSFLLPTISLIQVYGAWKGNIPPCKDNVVRRILDSGFNGTTAHSNGKFFFLESECTLKHFGSVQVCRLFCQKMASSCQVCLSSYSQNSFTLFKVLEMRKAQRSIESKKDLQIFAETRVDQLCASVTY